MKVDPDFGIVEKSTTRVCCIFCGVCLPQSSKCIEQHTSGAKHQDNIELMAENGIKCVDDELHCKICQRALGETESVSKHIECEDHANWMAAAEDLADGEYIRLDDYLSTDNDDISCDVCQTSIVCTLANIEEHVNKFSHISKLADKLKPLNGLFPVDNEEELWCKVCNDYIENTVQGILDHVDDMKHSEILLELEDLAEDNDISIKEYLSNEFKDKAFCNRCNVEVLCTPTSIENHIISEGHLNPLNENAL